MNPAEGPGKPDQDFSYQACRNRLFEQTNIDRVAGHNSGLILKGMITRLRSNLKELRPVINKVRLRLSPNHRIINNNLFHAAE